MVEKPLFNSIHFFAYRLISIFSSTKRINSSFAVTAERWCRLRGNLLFYFKSGDPGSQPAGLLVLENIRVKLDNSDIDGTFGLMIMSGQTKIQHLRSYTTGGNSLMTSPT